MLIAEGERVLCQLVFAGERSAKHRWIVTVQGDHEALIEIAAQRMLADPPAATGPQIARQANFYRDLTPRQLFDQLSILPGCKTVPNAFRPQIERTPN